MTANAPTTESDLEALVEAVRAKPDRRDELVGLLREDAAIYRNRGSATVNRIRGWVLASFADIGLPAAALPYVMESLQNDIDAYSVAAAAHAVRGLANPTEAVAAALVDALARMRARDDAVTFESLRPCWPAATSTSSLVEIISAIRSLGQTATAQRDRLADIRDTHAKTWSPAVRAVLHATIDALPTACCRAHHHTPTTEPTSPCGGTAPEIDAVPLQDQDGRRTTFGQWFSDRPAVLTFFYTRCPNPNKCSLTITKLAELHRRMDAAGLAGRVRIAAVTYDPGYDHPTRMRHYGQARHLQFGDDVAMLRAVEGNELLRRHFQLRVGYVGSIVNRHAIELYLTAPGGRPVHTWAQTRWDIDEVLEAARDIASAAETV